MPLAMARPYPHPKTGVYWVRKVVPANLRAAVGKRELVRSLGTKDPREARLKAPTVLSHFDAILTAARNGGASLTQRAVVALCGEWYRAECARLGDNPGREPDWEMDLEQLSEQLEDTGPENNPEEWEQRLRLKLSDYAAAAALLRQHGYAMDPASVAQMAEALFWTRRDLAKAMLRRAGGDWSPDPTLEKFPALPARNSAEPPPATGITFDALITAWAAESGTQGKALYDRQRTAANLARHLGHDDATRVTADDVVSWKEARLTAGKSVKTVANDIGELRPIWAWGKRNRKLSFVENPFAGLAPRVKKRPHGPRGPYTEDDAHRLLQAARGERTALLRWLPWLLCFTGCRIAEACQAVREDVKRIGEDGIWYLHVHGEGDGRTLKTVHSERMIPLHPALIAEGFIDYVRALPADSALFPDVRPDKFGSRGGTATKMHGRWVRRTVGITDTGKDPAHAWRHRMEDEARRAGVPQNVTDALLGHLNPMNESEGYGRGFRFMPEATAPWVAKLGTPLPSLGKAAA
jgi:integrase